MAEHNIEKMMGSHEEAETIIISSVELPDVVAWKNRQKYDVTRTYKGATQIRRTEIEDGTVFVELRLENEVLVEGNAS